MLHPQTHYLAHGAPYDGNSGMPIQRHAYRVCQQRTGAQMYLQHTDIRQDYQREAEQGNECIVRKVGRHRRICHLGDFCVMVRKIKMPLL